MKKAPNQVLYSFETTTILQKLRVDANQGLSEDEARRRLAEHGSNHLTVRRGVDGIPAGIGRVQCDFRRRGNDAFQLARMGLDPHGRFHRLHDGGSGKIVEAQVQSDGSFRHDHPFRSDDGIELFGAH